jgi:mRNA-degrading endonuclease toxin of MazEF toxin-antitoxin module
VVPLTSKELDKIRSYEILIKKDQVNGLEKDSKILFNRLRNVEKVTRLREYVGIVSEEVIQKAKEKLKLVLDLE